jgi:general secretion pathway protein D
VMRRVLQRVIVAAMLTLILACGASMYQKGRYAMDRGLYDDAVANLQKAVNSSPNNLKYKTELVRAKLAAGQKHMESAKMALAREDYATAALELQRSLEYDPSNEYSRDMMAKVLDGAKAKEEAERQSKMSIDAMKQATASDMGVPQLDPASNIPIVLKFNDAPLKTILDAISKASGINFLFDDRADTSKRISVDFAKVNLSQVMDYLMTQTKNFYKVLDPHTLIVVPDNKQKRDEYADQVIRTFYLSNAEAKDVFQLIRSILQTRKMAMNQDLNSITIQDTPEMVAIAQKIIEENDKSKGEVLVDVELLEVDEDKLRQLGINLTTNTFTIGPSHNVVSTTSSSGTTSTSIGSGPPIPLNELGQTLSHGLMVFPVPNLIVNMLLTDTNTQVLAKPQLRVLEGQKASVHIGQRVPIASATQYLGAQGTTTTYTPTVSYTYQDIGVKVEIEPKVHHNKEVTIKLKSEVSAIAGYVTAPSGSLSGDQPIIGTREATTVLRLDDGETSLLAGLIQRTNQSSLNGLPGVSEVPILRRLFSNTKDQKSTTDVVMLVTPHIIRMPNITEDDLKPLWVGTADNPKLKGFSGGSFAPSPFTPGSPATGGAAPPAAATGEKAQVSASTPEEQAKPNAQGQPETSGQPQGSDEGQPDKPAASAGRLLLSPTALSIKTGETAIVNLVIVGAQDLHSLHLEADFPSDVISFQGAEEGAFFKTGGAASSFSGAESRPGILALDASRADGQGAAGSGLLARLKFTGTKAGVARVNFGVAQGTLGSGSASLTPAFCVVTVADGGPPPVPEGQAAGSGQ